MARGSDVVQSLSHVQLFVISWSAACQASLPFTVFCSLLKLMSIELVMPSNHLILCCLLLLPSIFPSIRVFSNQSVVHIRWPKYCSCSFSISPSNEYSGLISLKVDWFDLHAFQRTRKSLLQHHSSKASIFLHLAFFMVQLESVIVPFLSFSFYSFPVVTSASPAPQWKQGRKYGLPLPTGSNKATSPFGHSIRRGQLKRQFK